MTWPNLGDYHPGDPPLVVTVTGRVDPASATGVVTDTVEVNSTLGHCHGGIMGQPLVGLTGIGQAALNGAFTLQGPRNVVAGAQPVRLPRREVAAPPAGGATLPRTGDGATHHAASTLALLALALFAVRTARRP